MAALLRRLQITSAASAASAASNVSHRHGLQRFKISSVEAIARFERETQLLRRCQHANIVSPLACLTRPPEYAIVLPYARAGNLSQVALRILRPAAGGAHSGSAA